MIFCRPKDKVTHFLNDGDGDGNRDKNSEDGVRMGTFCGDRDTAGGDGVEMGANPVGKGWGWG